MKQIKLHRLRSQIIARPVSRLFAIKTRRWGLGLTFPVQNLRFPVMVVSVLVRYLSYRNLHDEV
jgi:hypothetical protein